MDRVQAWENIRKNMLTSFYRTVTAEKLEQEIRLSKPVLKGQVNFTPFTELEKLHEEIDQLDNLLENERELTRKKQQEFSQRWEISYQRHQDLEKIMQMFAEYYEGNQQKVKADQARCRQARRESEEKDKEVSRLRKELAVLKEIQAHLWDRKHLCLQSKDFLKSATIAYNAYPNVVKGAESYTQIKDLLGRFNELKSIRDSKVQATLSNIEETVKAKTEEEMEKERSATGSLAYLSHKTRLFDYEEELKVEVVSLDQKLLKVKGDVHSKILKTGRPKMAIYSLYSNLANEVGQMPKLKERDVRGQLRYIQKYLGEMRKLSERVRESLKAGSDVPFPSDLEEYTGTSLRSSQ